MSKETEQDDIDDIKRTLEDSGVEVFDIDDELNIDLAEKDESKL